MSISHRGNRVREQRLQRGWSQAELAERTGVSRTAVTAIEGNRLSPSVAAALALAHALGTTVESLFGGGGESGDASGAAWAWEGPRRARGRWRYWQAEVGGRVWCFPVERTGELNPAHDGVAETAVPAALVGKRASETLVLAGCDPAAGVLASEYQRQTGLRMIVLSRSSGEALELVRRGHAHIAGLHFAGASDADGEADANERTVRSRLDGPFHLLCAADWQEGLAYASDRSVNGLSDLLKSNLRWVGRSLGSAARALQDRLLPPARQIASCAPDHRAVAIAIRGGWADTGVCVRLVSEEAGLDFFPVRKARHDLCYPANLEHDRRIQSLVLLTQSVAYRQLIGELPGYETHHMGELRSCVGG